ncbi:MAG: nucleotidyltransferase [Lentisphaerae bacterium]|jgi:hypothetical protein|nr:nucleotidyltransferase [Lentisphaerota bacterium]MBT5607876.1 nucleotidyltransferase [Lentisphaerota bacterium]MBT7058267.1 nucleotidyltransferase [Lentisphaerota bacterium]MBT7842805.1 nucleotidyltransferase [Lentisphaerota bacterium]
MALSLEVLLRKLVQADVDFVIVGGYAAVFHGSTMVTQDLHICCDFSTANLTRLGEALRDLQPVHRMTPQRIPLEVTPTFCRGLRNLYLSTSCGQIDCLSEVKGLGDFSEVSAVSQPAKLPWGTCRVLSLEALIKAKRAMGRPRDQEAVLQLESIRERVNEDDV